MTRFGGTTLLGRPADELMVEDEEEARYTRCCPVGLKYHSFPRLIYSHADYARAMVVVEPGTTSFAFVLPVVDEQQREDSPHLVLAK